MRAHAAASAVGIHGSSLPSTQTPLPNMMTKSFTSNVSTDTELGKLGKEKPSVSGRMVVATDSAFTSSAPRMSTNVVASAVTTTTAPTCFAPMLKRFTATTAPALATMRSNTSNTYRDKPELSDCSGLRSAILICDCSNPIDNGRGSPEPGFTITSITLSDSPILSFVAEVFGSSLVHSCTPD